jgi:hypothetical protein
MSGVRMSEVVAAAAKVVPKVESAFSEPDARKLPV